MTLDITQFYQTFFDEADELLAEMERLLLGLDVAHPESEDLNAIFRAAHSIKGGAATFGFTALTDTTHILESLLDRARTGELTLRTDMVDLFLETKDVLHELLQALRASTDPDPDLVSSMCGRLQALADAESGKSAAPAPAPAAPKPAAPVAAAPAPAPAVVDPSEPPGHLVQQLQELAGVLGSDAAGAHAEGAEGKPCLKVKFTGVSERDRDLLVEEVGNLGKILDRSEQGKVFTLWLETDCDPDDIMAVCCFVIDGDQIDVSRGIYTPQEIAEAELSAQVQKVDSGAAPATAPAAASASNPASTPAASPASAAPVAAPPVEAAPAPSAALSVVPAPANPEAAAKAPAASGAAAAAPRAVASENSSIRVGVEKVDQLINLVGELVITQAMLAQTATAFDPVLHERLFNGLGQLQRNAHDLQEAVMSIRMMPMDYVFSRFPRLVRDLASKLGKEIELVTFGQATELDKSLIERIIDPLTHLVRNSLDHGIETPDVRVAAGKDAVGQLILSAEHQGGNIVIEVSDDGAGLRRDKILAKAAKQGLPSSESMSDEDVWQMIFMPGFSTAEKVTDVSGRGVGMDVVKRNIQGMGGHVEIQSRAGQGTTTRVVLPLTLAILDGMLVKVGSEVFILPLNFVMESLQPSMDDIYQVAGDERVVRVRGEYLPLVELHSFFQVENARTDPTQGIVTIMQAEGRRFALLVDDLLGQQQVVLKNLETNYRKVRGISAATILGDGSVALIVDVATLNRSAQSMRDKPAGKLAAA
ncbi:chemotaxis protein CheA [Burkholderia sp. L27(2015)]|uniref:chemotaxis protein CheA n=1 Tax=Burkholderia sp. L27(2015) TaxID=1641858 RepID=UPI00131A7258|nr:chemotaxis protein CheA [Burkholderia sp. L27(2015)]